MAEKIGRPALKRTAMRVRLEERGIEMEELARYLELSIPQTYRIVAGTCVPRPAQAKRLRELLGLSWEDIFLGE